MAEMRAPTTSPLPRESSQPPSLALICLAGLGSGVVLHQLTRRWPTTPSRRRPGSGRPRPGRPSRRTSRLHGRESPRSQRRGGPTPCFFGQVPPRRSYSCIFGRRRPRHSCWSRRVSRRASRSPLLRTARSSRKPAAVASMPRRRSSSRRSWCPVGAVGGAAGAPVDGVGGRRRRAAQGHARRGTR